MRCTKCHYLSFEPEPRCRNCGHDLSIDELTLPLDDAPFDAAPVDHVADLELDRGPIHSLGSLGRADRGGAGVATLTPPAVAKAPAVAPVTTDLPLFMKDMKDAEDDEGDEELVPLVKVPARPRAPLSVRRPTPDPVKLRAKYAPEPDLLAAVDEPSAAPVPPSPMWAEAPLHTVDEEAPAPAATALAGGAVAPFGTRLAAAAIDAAVLAGIAAAVVAFTLRMAELSLAQVTVLPVVPMLAFLALIALGYEWLFTAAGGQTIGKMLTGLRVVSDADLQRPSPRQSMVRAVSLLPLGAGLVTAVAQPGLALHDRVAHTRVVRV